MEGLYLLIRQVYVSEIQATTVLHMMALGVFSKGIENEKWAALGGTGSKSRAECIIFNFSLHVNVTISTCCSNGMAKLSNCCGVSSPWFL